MPLITSQNAVSMALRSHQARRQRKLAEQAKPARPQPPPEDADTFLRNSITRARGTIERLSNLLDKETEPSKINHLCTGLAKLYETERILSNRPAPGNLRFRQIDKRPRQYMPGPEPSVDSLPQTHHHDFLNSEPKLDPDYQPPAAPPAPVMPAPAPVPMAQAIHKPPAVAVPPKPKVLVSGPNGVPVYR